MPNHDLPPTPPTVESTPARSALEAAIAHLRRGLRRDGTYAGVSEWDVTGYQWKRLVSWASSQGLNLPGSVGPTKEGGREHDVHFDDATKRWLKFTKPAGAGYAVEMVEGALLMIPASPLQYLERWKTHNHLFFDDVELAGVRSEGNSYRIVVSQQDWGDDTPTWEEIERAMVEDYRLERLPTGNYLGGYEARAYFHGRFAVFDLRPVNCACSAGGIIVPFDVIPQVFTLEEMRRLRDTCN